jgi:virginiamycin B lyase
MTGRGNGIQTEQAAFLTTLLGLAISVAGTLFLSASSAAAVADPVFYELPPATHAYSMTAGPEGAIWFTGERAYTGSTPAAAVVGRIGQNGEVKIFDIPSRRGAGQIAAGPDGNLWFSETYENKRGYLVARIGRMSPAGKFAEWHLGNHVGGVQSLTAGPGGAIWFTAIYSVSAHKKAVVGRIDAAGQVHRFHLPPTVRPGGITAGPGGNLWFTERGAGDPMIARITPGGRITEFPLPVRGWQANWIVAGAEGNLWFGEQTAPYSRNFGERLGRITTMGRIAEFHVPVGGYTGDLAPKPGGGVWYTASTGSGPGAFGPEPGPFGIGSIGPGGAAVGPVCVKPNPCETDADALAVGADGSLWFAASKYYSHGGGGGTGLLEGLAEAAEAGLVGRFAPGATPP